MSKLKFHVVFASSEEADYPASELNIHGPSTKGWQSVKFAKYPQEIGIEIDSKDGNPYDVSLDIGRISQIQVLSHHSKISSKIEVFVGSGGMSYETATFKRLGYFALDSNEKSQFQARELKSVYVDVTGRYVKFLLNKNYENQLNYWKQVGLVAINLIGNELQRSTRAAISGVEPSDNIATFSNPLNDLSIDMNLDATTTVKLRLLSEAKVKAVSKEDYVTAKKIKLVENDLKDIGMKLARLDIEKRKAVENEDYDTAKELKDQCDALRDEIERKIYAVNIPGVTDGRLAAPRRESRTEASAAVSSFANSSTGEAKDYGSSPPSVRRMSAKPDVEDEYEDYPEDDARPIKPKASTFYNDRDPEEGYDDVESDAKGEAFPPGQHPLENVPNFSELPLPEDLSSKSREILDQGVIALIGEYRARCLVSKTWSLRVAALTKVSQLLQEFERNPGISSAIVPLSVIVRLGIEDKMQQVFVEATSLLDELLTLIGKASIPRSTITSLFDPIITQLFEKLADSNIRMNQGARSCLEAIVKEPSVGPIPIANHALKTLSAKHQGLFKVVAYRIRLISSILSTAGIGSSSGISIDAAMNFTKNLGAVSHANGEVRDAAKALIVTLQKIVGTAGIQPYLDDLKLRPKQLSEIVVAFEGGGWDVVIPPAAAPAKGAVSSRQPSKADQPTKLSSTPKASAGKVDPPTQSHGKPPSNKNTPAKQEAGPSNYTVCMFCGASDPKWNEDALDLHFWKTCPLLVPCPACSQVVEIAGLPEHFLEECDKKTEYSPCDVTGLAVRTDELATWQKSKNCRPPPENCIYCPLCLSSVEDSDEAWKDHLMHGCPRNSRVQN